MVMWSKASPLKPYTPICAPMEIARFRGFLSKANEFLGVRHFFSYTLYSEVPGWRQMRDEATRLLSKRISPLGDPTASIVPVLDQWVREGNEVNKPQLTNIIKELRSYKRYSHALQVSMWMSEKRFIKLTPSDNSVRLELISKVYNMEEAENYFNKIPVHQRSLGVYSALLYGYANVNCVEKAECLMNKMRGLGLTRGSAQYSVLLGIYQRTGNFEKMESLIQEMKDNQISFNRHTYCVLIKAYAAKSDPSGIEEILKKAESDDAYGRHWSVYSTAAQGYIETGNMEKAISALRISEKIITNSVNDHLAYDLLITLYAKAGYRDDVLRVWEIYNKKKRVLNRGYNTFVSALLRLEDIEKAEQVFEEWKSKGLALHIRLPNLLISYYCKKGLVEKGRAMIEEMISKGAKLDAKTWYCLATCDLHEGRSQEAVEAMKQSLKIATTIDISKWPEYKDALEACLKFLNEEGNVEVAEELVRLFEQKCNASSDVFQRLLQYTRGERQNPNVFGESDE